MIASAVGLLSLHVEPERENGEQASARSKIPAYAVGQPRTPLSTTNARWFAGLSDPRPDVRASALFALATVVVGLDDVTFARIASNPRNDLQEALAAYRSRTGRSNPGA